MRFASAPNSGPVASLLFKDENFQVQEQQFAGSSAPFYESVGIGLREFAFQSDAAFMSRWE
jgi:hypothetical protein